MRLQEEINDLQSSTEDCEEEICHFEKLLSDRSRGEQEENGEPGPWCTLEL